MGLIGMDLHSFAVAGSFVIFFLALKMILGISLFKEEALEVASIVPLAFTVIAGAETITTLLTLRAEYGLVKIQSAKGAGFAKPM